MLVVICFRSTQPFTLRGMVKWVPAKRRCWSVAGEVTAGLAESNGRLLLGGWLKSPAGWLPVHRDQLRAQCLVTSMGCLYLLVICSDIHANLYMYIVTTLWQKFSILEVLYITLSSSGSGRISYLISGRIRMQPESKKWSPVHHTTIVDRRGGLAVQRWTCD